MKILTITLLGTLLWSPPSFAKTIQHNPEEATSGLPEEYSSDDNTFISDLYLQRGRIAMEILGDRQFTLPDGRSFSSRPLLEVWQRVARGEIKVEIVTEELTDRYGRPADAVTYPDRNLTKIKLDTLWLLDEIQDLRMTIHETLRYVEEKNPAYNDDNYRISQYLTFVLAEAVFAVVAKENAIRFQGSGPIAKKLFETLVKLGAALDRQDTKDVLTLFQMKCNHIYDLDPEEQPGSCASKKRGAPGFEVYAPGSKVIADILTNEMYMDLDIGRMGTAPVNIDCSRDRRTKKVQCSVTQ